MRVQVTRRRGVGLRRGGSGHAPQLFGLLFNNNTDKDKDNNISRKKNVVCKNNGSKTGDRTVFFYKIYVHSKAYIYTKLFYLY